MLKKISNLLFTLALIVLALFLFAFMSVPDFRYEKIGREMFKEQTGDIQNTPRLSERTSG